MRRFLHLYILLSVWLAVSAQPHCNVRVFSLHDGLASNVISSMVQTPDQMMWFSTWNGLCCYDGYTFNAFNDPFVKERTLTTNRLLKVYVANNGNLWCLTYDRQVFLFNRSTSRFINLSSMVAQQSGKDFICQRIVPLKNGFTWLFSREKGESCFRIDERMLLQSPTSACIQEFSPVNTSKKWDDVYGVEIDGKGSEWLLTDKGPYIVGKQLKDATPYSFWWEDGQNVVLVSKDGRIGRYDRQHNVIVPIKGFPGEAKNVSSVGHFGEHGLVMLTDQGLNVWHTDSNLHKYFPFSAGDGVKYIISDHRKRVWAITSEGNVLLITVDKGQVERVPMQVPLNSLRQSTRNFVHEDNYGNCWIGTEQGFFGYYDEVTHQLVPYSVRTNNAEPTIDKWFVDAHGDLWFSGEHDVAVINFTQSMFRHHDLEGMQQVRSVCYDSQNRLWVGDITGHVAVTDQTGKVEGFLGSDGQLHQAPTIFSTHIYCIYEDSRHRMWIGTKGDGLYCLKGKGRLSHYQHDKTQPFSLCSDQIYAMHEDLNHRLWVGTFEGGIALVDEDADGNGGNSAIRFIHAGNLLKNYPVDDYNKVRRITETKDGAIIVSASNGLVTFSEHFDSPEKITFFAHKHIHGDPSSLFTSDVMHSYVDHTGRILVATVGGGVQEIIGKNPLSKHLRFAPVTLLDNNNYGTVLSMSEDAEENLWIGCENSLMMYQHQLRQLFRFGTGDLGEHAELTESQSAFNPLTGELAFATTDGYISFQPKQIGHEKILPPIVFKSVLFHGADVPLRHIQDDVLLVPSNRRNLTIQFAALDYQDNSMIRYAYMLEGVDKDWVELDEEHSITYSHLPSGKLKLKVRSTNHYGIWVDNDKTLLLDVRPTFWETWWAKLLYLLLAIAVIGIAVWIYRLRTRASMERQLNNMKTLFFTDVSHQLRTPLTLIGGPVSQVLNTEHLTNVARQHLEMVQRNTHRMLELVNSMLTYGKDYNTYISDWEIPKGEVPTDEPKTATSTPAGVTSSEEDMDKGEDKTRLLVVEDNNDLRAFLVSILQSDYVVSQASNGREGLEKAMTEQPDFILTDVMMPEMDGLEMVHRIKDNHDISHIPIIILSAKASMEDRLEGLRAGVNDYITKPFSATYLKQRMQNIIANQRILQKNFLESVEMSEAVSDEHAKEAPGMLQLKETKIVDSDKDMMDQLLEYIEEHLADSELKIEDLAAAVCLGRSVFYNKVKSIVGMSPVELLRHIRIKHAEDMVSKSNEPFSQIAYAVGFSDARYFGKCFKKETGLTPSEYRDRSSSAST